MCERCNTDENEGERAGPQRGSSSMGMDMDSVVDEGMDVPTRGGEGNGLENSRCRACSNDDASIGEQGDEGMEAAASSSSGAAESSIAYNGEGGSSSVDSGASGLESIGAARSSSSAADSSSMGYSDGGETSVSG